MASIHGLHTSDLSRFLHITQRKVKHPVTEQVLQQIFQLYGATTVQLCTRRTAVVSFPTMAQATRAALDMQGCCIWDNCCWMQIRFAQEQAVAAATSAAATTAPPPAFTPVAAPRSASISAARAGASPATVCVQGPALASPAPSPSVLTTADEEKPVTARLAELQAALDRVLANFAPIGDHGAAATSSPSTTTATAPDESQIVPELVPVVLAPNVAIPSASSASALTAQQEEKTSTESPKPLSTCSTKGPFKSGDAIQVMAASLLAADAHMTVHEQEEATPTSAMPQLLGVVMPASGLPVTRSTQHKEADEERPMPWPSFVCDCQRMISMQPQQTPQDTQPWGRNAFNPDLLGEMAGANESLVCSFVSHTITASCQMMDVEHTPHLHDAWNMVEGTNSWPAKMLLLEIVVAVHISWRWHLLEDGGAPCQSSMSCASTLQPKPPWLLNAQSARHVANIPGIPMPVLTKYLALQMLLGGSVREEWLNPPWDPGKGTKYYVLFVQCTLVRGNPKMQGTIQFVLGQFVGTTKLKGNGTWTIRCLQQGSGLETISVLCSSSCCYTSIHTLLSQLPGSLEQPFSDYLNLLGTCCKITSPDLPLYGNDGVMGHSIPELVVQTKWDSGGQIIRDQTQLSVAYEFARAGIQLGPSDILLFVPLLPVHCTMTCTTRRATETAGKCYSVQCEVLATRNGNSVLAIDLFVQWDPGIMKILLIAAMSSIGKLPNTLEVYVHKMVSLLH